MKTITKRISLLLIAAMLLSVFTFGASAAELPQSQATFTFTETAIAGEGAVLSNEIAGTTLTIKQSGVYTLAGSCTEGNVIIAKGVTGVTLILNNFKLESAKAAPISVENKAELTLYVLGTCALNNKTVRPAKTETPAEAAPAEAAPAEAAPAEAAPAEAAPAEAEAAAATVNAKNGKWNKNGKWAKKADDTQKKAKQGNGFVGAAIKVKANAKLVVNGEGALFLNSTVRNPIGVAKKANATFKGGVNFSKKFVAKAAKPAEAPAAEPVAEPVAEVTEPAAEQKEEAPAAEAAPAPEAVEVEEGASATVNARKNGKNAKNGKNFKGQKNQKNQKNRKNGQGKPVEIKAGEVLTVKDAEGNVILSLTAPIDAKQVIILSEKLTAKQAYGLFAGETQLSKATARASAKLNAQANNKKNNKFGKNNKNRNRGNRKNFGKQAQPAAAPAETANVA